LPRPISAPVYARIGDAPTIIVILVALIVVVRRRLRANTMKT
jgi:apolipoprotein N-acyltransferase